MTDQTAAMVEITIDPLRKRIRIHRETLKQLRYPAYVQFLVNPEKSYMAVLGSDRPLRGGTANRLRIDPAVASGPLITTVNDLIAVVTYYGLAWLLLINTLGM